MVVASVTATAALSAITKQHRVCEQSGNTRSENRPRGASDDFVDAQNHFGSLVRADEHLHLALERLGDLERLRVNSRMSSAFITDNGAK